MANDPLSIFMGREKPIQAEYSVSPESKPAPSFAQVFKMLSSANNPMEMFMQMAGNSKELQTVMQMVRENGGDAKGLFYKLCEQKKVDPESILSQLR